MSTELLQLTVRLSQSCQQSYYSWQYSFRSHVNRVTAADSTSVAVMSTELLQLTLRLSQSRQQSYCSWQYICRSHVNRVTATDSTSVQALCCQHKTSPETPKFCPPALSKSSTSFSNTATINNTQFPDSPVKTMAIINIFSFYVFLHRALWYNEQFSELLFISYIYVVS